MNEVLSEEQAMQLEKLHKTGKATEGERESACVSDSVLHNG